MEIVTLKTLEAFECDLVDRARCIRAYACAPISHFRVGAAIFMRHLSDSSNHEGIFEGCNAENAILEVIHAEQAAIANMVHRSGPRPKNIRPLIETIAIALEAPREDQHALPCGLCRQWICEYGKPETKILGAKLNDKGEVIAVEVTTIGELLPFAFGLQNLGP